MKVLIGHRVLSEVQRYTPAHMEGGGFNRYDGFQVVEGIYKDHRRIKREKRRAQRRG